MSLTPAGPKRPEPQAGPRQATAEGTSDDKTRARGCAITPPLWEHRKILANDAATENDAHGRTKSGRRSAPARTPRRPSPRPLPRRRPDGRETRVRFDWIEALGHPPSTRGLVRRCSSNPIWTHWVAWPTRCANSSHGSRVVRATSGQPVCRDQTSGESPDKRADPALSERLQPFTQGAQSTLRLRLRSGVPPNCKGDAEAKLRLGARSRERKDDGERIGALASCLQDRTPRVRHGTTLPFVRAQRAPIVGRRVSGPISPRDRWRTRGYESA